MSCCQRICIDDLCRGNRDDTLCGGSYCYHCDKLTVDGSVCDQCREENEENDAAYMADDCE